MIWVTREGYSRGDVKDFHGGKSWKAQENMEAELMINVSERGIKIGDVRDPVFCQVAGFDICDV